MGQLKPFLYSEDARAQAEFYKECLGGEIMSVITYEQAMGAKDENRHKVIHLCVVVADGNAIFMADSLEPVTQGNGFAMNLVCKTESEAKEAYARLADGGRVKNPVELQPFGMYYGDLADKYGVTWMITAQPEM